MNNRFVLPLLAVAAAVIGFLVAQSQMSAPTSGGVTRTLADAREGLRPFELTRADGARFTLDDLKDRWSMVFFGYTNCPDICPTTLSDLREVYVELSDSARDQTQILFISVDPERDNPQQLGEYVHYFHPDFVGVTGTDAQLQNISAQLYAVYSRGEGTPEAGYEVDHSSRVLLINPDTKLHAVFQHNQAPISIQTVIEKAMREWSS